MRIAEIFYSIQGEGKLTGVPSVFVRVSGCNLRCTWCDTPYASWNPEGPDLTVPQIVDAVAKHDAARHVVLTGGEPMMFKDIVPLITALKDRHLHITVETAGTLWQPDLPDGGIDLASISPKLSNSTPWQREGGRFAAAHEHHRLNFPVLATFAAGGTGGGGVGEGSDLPRAVPAVLDRQWKFVISSPDNLREVESLLTTLNARLPADRRIAPADVLLMPEATDPAALTARSRTLAEVCKEKGYRLSPRLHVYLWGNTKGT
jgi:7-carboxy-7-deazaguanine synthase